MTMFGRRCSGLVPLLMQILPLAAASPPVRQVTHPALRMRLKWNAFWENASKRTCKPLFTLFFGLQHDLRPVLHLHAGRSWSGPDPKGGGGWGLCERGNDTSKSTGRSGRQKAVTRRNMRREERVTVQGPVKEQQPDGMSHRGGALQIAKWLYRTMGFVRARGAGDFVLGIRQGEIFWFEPMCLYSKYSEFCGEIRNG